MPLILRKLFVIYKGRSFVFLFVLFETNLTSLFYFTCNLLKSLADVFPQQVIAYCKWEYAML